MCLLLGANTINHFNCQNCRITTETKLHYPTVATLGNTQIHPNTLLVKSSSNNTDAYAPKLPCFQLFANGEETLHRAICKAAI